ncbi:MAG TPA: cytochrome D1 domain-containing protein [Longimicrobiales bacterium]|nr:cytochrome D1 domain-containing protein [Longimicrobiales bacterium]
MRTPTRIGRDAAVAALFGLLAACGPQMVETPPPSPADFPTAQGGEEEPQGRVEGTARLVRQATTPVYRLYVANESSDNVMRVAFTPGRGATVEKTIPVGIMPGDIDGAHGIAVSPADERWYVTVAHGTPYGYLWQFATGSDSLVARTELGLFPATMGVTPDGSFLLAVNFNLHGDMVPSDVSVVYTKDLTEMARVTTCLMPHGSRVNAAGTRHYSACMHSDQVVEIDVQEFEVTKRYSVAPGRERPLAPTNRGERRASGAGGEARAGAEAEGAAGAQPVCSPTWVEPARGRRADHFIYVACNKHDEVLELSTEAWRVTRRFPTGSAPYNLETTADGRWLVATLKGEQKVAFFDLDRGEEVARVATSRPVTHGVVSSPDNRYVFVTNESVGSTPGTLDVFDLRTRERVASVELGHQSGGIDFWEIGRGGR